MSETPTADCYRGRLCSGCGKHVTDRRAPPTRCADCGGHYVEATPARLACDRCGEQDASRVFGPTDHSRLCQGCIGEVNNAG